MEDGLFKMRFSSVQVSVLRNRSDGKFYAVDFMWKEIRNLTKTSSFNTVNGREIPVFPGRFPLWKSKFLMNTLEQELQMVRGMEKSMGKKIGIYPEIKNPLFHRKEGKNITT